MRMFAYTYVQYLVDKGNAINTGAFFAAYMYQEFFGQPEYQY